MTNEFAFRQLKRLDIFPYRRMSNEAQLEYVRAIKTAENEDVADRVISDFCQYGEKFPLPSDLIKAIANQQGGGHEQPLKTCATCGGSGYVIVENTYKGPSLLLQQMYQGMPILTTQRCRSCSGGKAIRGSREAPTATRSSSAMNETINDGRRPPSAEPCGECRSLYSMTLNDSAQQEGGTRGRS